MHPHTLIGLLGHDITDQLLAILDAGAQSNVNIELDRWSRAVQQAAQSIRYDSQLELARQLEVDSDLCHSTSLNDLLVGSTMKIFLWVRSSRLFFRACAWLSCS